jgi:hypothetical protein
MPVKITFVLIVDKQVQTAETIDGDLQAITRRITRIQYEGYDLAVAVFGDGAKWDLSFPMTTSEIKKTSIKLHSNL